MIARNTYINKIISKQWNGRVKIITGIRRCGKSTILFELFRQHLLSEGVSEEDIISIALDQDRYAQLRDRRSWPFISGTGLRMQAGVFTL